MNAINPPTIESKTDGNVNTSIRDKILHLLRIYPIVSPSMLQIGIGSSLPTSIWRPVLQELLDTGEVKEDIIVSLSAAGRNQSYTLLSLKDTPTKHINPTTLTTLTK